MIYFKNGLFIGEKKEFSNGYDFSYSGTLDLKKLKMGCKFNYDTKEIIETQTYTDNNNIFLKSQKKEECRQLILERYSETDQRNALLFGTEEKKIEMSEFINSVITEYRTNGKDADFSTITP